MKRMSVMMFLAIFLLSCPLLASCDNNPKQAVSKVVFEPLPTPRLEEAQRLIYEQLKKEEVAAAEKTQKKPSKNGGKKTALASKK